MKFIVSIILTAILSFLACLYLPWWSIAIVSFAVPLMIVQKPYLAFLTGFIALFLLWGGLAFWISTVNNHILAQKISILVVKSDAPLLLVAVTAFIGGIVAAFSALSGALFRKLF